MILKKIMIKCQIIILLPPPVDDDHGHGSVIDVHFYMIILFDGLGFCNFFIEFCTQISLQNKDRNNGRGCTNVLHPWTLKVSNVQSLVRKKNGSPESGQLKIPGQPEPDVMSG